MKITNTHWAVSFLILAGAVFVAIVASEKYLAKRGTALVDQGS